MGTIGSVYFDSILGIGLVVPIFVTLTATIIAGLVVNNFEK